MKRSQQFNETRSRGRLGEALAAAHFESAGWTVTNIPEAEQLAGAGDLRLEAPVAMLVCELEVKACFGEGPNCLLELSTGGTTLRASGVLGTKAEQVMIVRMRDEVGFLFRARLLETLVGDWLRAFCPIRLRDEDARTWRQCLPVPWHEIENHGLRIRLGLRQQKS